MPFVSNRFLLFILVGVGNTMFGYGIFALFIFMGMHYVLAVLLSTILGVLFNFKSTGGIVFKSHDNRLIFRFFFVYSIIMIINMILLKLSIKLAFNMYLASFVITIPMAFVSYFFQKNFVFSKLRRCNASD